MNRLITIILFSVILTATGIAQSRMIPLNDLGTGTYKAYQGGLYPNGSNVRPHVHDSAGLALAAGIHPLNAAGEVDDAAGRIVLLSIGMSNATQEFSVFKSIADTDHVKNTKVVIVDGAQGGQTTSIIAQDTVQFWRVIDQRLNAAGVTAKQVQAVWLKEADANPTDAFPQHALTMENELVAVVHILKKRYPNIRLTYLSSRTYGGYAMTTLNPEPFAYEEGFAVKWLIEQQINGDSALAYRGKNARAPWLAWGPYLWADSLNPRSDGLTWSRADFGGDGTHPSTQGRLKVAGMLLDFLKKDSTAASWFTSSSTLPLPEPVVLISPPDSFVVRSTGTIPFTWQPGQPQVNRYLFERANNPNFLTGPIDTFAVGHDTVLTSSMSLPFTNGGYGNLWWRVKAGNDAGWGPYSETRALFWNMISGSVEPSAVAIHGAVLYPNTPNPFAASTTIRFSLPSRGHITLRVVDALGREVRRLIDGEMAEGEHTVAFDGEGLASGFYRSALVTEGGVMTQRMQIVR